MGESHQLLLESNDQRRHTETGITFGTRTGAVNMAHKVLIVDSVPESSELILARFKEQYGEDVILITPEEALEQKLTPKDFANLPSFKITAPPEIPLIQTQFKDGKQLRRERRKKQRRSKR